jgi:hypothetical protein
MARFVIDTAHAYQRMRRWSITWEMINEVLDHPDEIRPAPRLPGRRPAIIYIAALDNNRIRVYVESGSDPLAVVTVAREER